MEEEAVRIASEVPDNSSCLIGGSCIIMEKLSLELLKKGCVLYSILTERKSDKDGNFSFEFAGLQETPLYKAFKAKKITFS